MEPIPESEIIYDAFPIVKLATSAVHDEYIHCFGNCSLDAHYLVNAVFGSECYAFGAARALDDEKIVMYYDAYSDPESPRGKHNLNFAMYHAQQILHDYACIHAWMQPKDSPSCQKLIIHMRPIKDTNTGTLLADCIEMHVVDRKSADAPEEWYRSILHHVIPGPSDKSFVFDPCREYKMNDMQLKPCGLYFAPPGEWTEFLEEAVCLKHTYAGSRILQGQLRSDVQVVRFSDDLVDSTKPDKLWLIDEKNVNLFYTKFMSDKHRLGPLGMRLDFDRVSKICRGLIVDPTNYRQGSGTIAPLWLSLWDVRTVVVWRDLDRVLTGVRV